MTINSAKVFPQLPHRKELTQMVLYTIKEVIVVAIQINFDSKRF